MLEAGFLRRCTNAECGQQHFPRTDPAVIVLVTHEDARRFTREDIAADVDAGELRLSPRTSISRHLIESWRLLG